MNISAQEIRAKLLATTRQLLLELGAQRALQALTLDASLEKALGIDSLGKVELFHRIEEAFSIRLPEKAMIESDTLEALAKVIEESSTARTTKRQSKVSTQQSAELDVSRAGTLLDVLKLYHVHRPHLIHLYWQNEKGEEQIIRYGELYQKGMQIAAGLLQEGVQPGDRVAIMLPTSDAFFYAFMGVLLMGGIPVPIYPPFRPDRIEEYIQKQAKILINAQATLLITFSQAQRLNTIFRNFIPELKSIKTIDMLRGNISDVPELEIHPQITALIQYTSGSTGDPKGVVLSHANFLANIRAIGSAIGVKPTEAGVSWLPLYHDMGLMSWLAGLYYGAPITIMSPITFLTRPASWLWAIHYHRGTISGGPNFAYELCIKKINSEEIAGLDLSSWRFAFNGAEAVSSKTIDAFCKKFEPYGFKAEAFAPVYGLAESTVALTFPPVNRGPSLDRIQRDIFEKEGKATPVTDSSKQESLTFVGCGEPLPDMAVKIVDENGNVLLDRQVGKLYFQGPSAMQGYFNNPSATQNAFKDEWWDSGDLAYHVGKEIFITGRKKDLIIKAGRNLYPEEVEAILNEIPNIRKGCAVAFGVSSPTTGTEKLIVVAEIYDMRKKIKQQIEADIIEKMAIDLGVAPDTILLVKPRTIPKTSSGKLQRSACKEAFLAGKLIRTRLPVQIQLARLAMKSGLYKIKQFLLQSLKVFHSIYVGLILLITVPCVWFMILLLTPRPAAKVVKIWAGLFFRVIFCPIRVKGKLHPQTQICVSNHASYADSVVLLSVLPPGTVFTVKKELLKTPIISTFVKKLQFITVDRLDFSQSLEDKKMMEQAIGKGQSLVIFPEGTFTDAPGLRPFKLGAFALSVSTQTPICPVSIAGTRAILRGNSLLTMPGVIHVTISDPISPISADWQAVMTLHAALRTEIAKHCGEPILDIVSAGIEPKEPN